MRERIRPPRPWVPRPQPLQPSRSLRMLPWVMGTVALVFTGVVYAESVLGYFVDVVVYQFGGQAVLDHANIYDSLASGVALPFTYPPFAAILFAPLAPLSTPVAQFAWTTASLAALIRVSWLIAASARLRAWSQSERFVIVFGVGALMEPIYATFAFGQINLIIMWLILEDLIGIVPARWRGTLIGIAAGIKIVPGLFVIYLAITGRSRDATRAIGAFAGTVIAGALLGLGQSWTYWTSTAYDSQRTGPVAILSNQSVRAVLLRLRDGSFSGLDGRTLTVVQLVASVSIVGVGLWAARQWFRRGEPLLAASLVGVTALLLSPISWSHHWIWLLPLTFGLLATGLRRMQWLAVLVVTVPVVRVIWWAPHRFDAVYDYHGLGHVLADAYFLLGLITIVWCAVEVRRTPQSPLHESPALSRAVDWSHG